MNKFATAIVALMLTGCMTMESQMNSFVGKDITEAIAKNGPPTNVFNMPDGRRAFQWFRNRDLIMPVTTNVAANNYGNYGYAQATTSGGYMGSTQCYYTLYARKSGNSYKVVGIEKPSFSCN